MFVPNIKILAIVVYAESFIKIDWRGKHNKGTRIKGIVSRRRQISSCTKPFVVPNIDTKGDVSIYMFKEFFALI